MFIIIAEIAVEQNILLSSIERQEDWRRVWNSITSQHSLFNKISQCLHVSNHYLACCAMTQRLPKKLMWGLEKNTPSLPFACLAYLVENVLLVQKRLACLALPQFPCKCIAVLKISFFLSNASCCPPLKYTWHGCNFVCHCRRRRTKTGDASSSIVLFTYSDDGHNPVKTRDAKTLSRHYRSAQAQAQKRRKNHRNKNRKRNLCQRHAMFVDFQDVGWNDWIVAPPGKQKKFQIPFLLQRHHALV